VDITVRFIDAAKKQHGGQRSALIHLGWQTLCGARHIRSCDSGFALEPDVSPANAELSTTSRHLNHDAKPMIQMPPRRNAAAPD
jgi:hypothetical protein